MATATIDRRNVLVVDDDHHMLNLIAAGVCGLGARNLYEAHCGGARRKTPVCPNRRLFRRRTESVLEIPKPPVSRQFFDGDGDGGGDTGGDEGISGDPNRESAAAVADA